MSDALEFEDFNSIEEHLAYLEQQSQEFAERKAADEKIQNRYVLTMRLVLWLIRYVWPRLTTEERAEVRSIIPDEMETDIRNALNKLP